MAIAAPILRRARAKQTEKKWIILTSFEQLNITYRELIKCKHIDFSNVDSVQRDRVAILKKSTKE